MGIELWGTFSVRDHIAERGAFNTSDLNSALKHIESRD